MRTSKGETAPFLSGVILAAGAASRMGRPKQLLLLEGRPLLQHVLDEAVASCLDEIIIVLGCQAPEIRDAIRIDARRGVHVAVNADYARGQSTSLRAGLRAASPRAAAAAILLGDQPQVTRNLIDQVAAAFAAAGLPVARPVYVGSKGGRVPGHPVFLSRRIWPEVEKLQGDEGARSILAAHPEWLLEVPVEGEPPADIDTWQDYERAVEGEDTPTPPSPSGRGLG